MKKILSLLLSVLLYANNSAAHEEDDDKDPNLYMVIANVIFDEFRFPLVGFANISMNNQKLPQIGFVNYNDGNFSSAQIGFTNNIKGNLDGIQIGFSNVVVKKFSGVQIGFFNFADSIGSGVPIGAVSYIKNGGYHALEVSTTAKSLVNFALKMGIEKFYTTLGVSYDKDATIFLALHAGIGSKIRVGSRWFVNPEMDFFTNAWGGSQQYIAGNILAGCNVFSAMSVVFGPQFVVPITGSDIVNPVYSTGKIKIGSKNVMVFGGKIGLCYEF